MKKVILIFATFLVFACQSNELENLSGFESESVSFQDIEQSMSESLAQVVVDPLAFVTDKDNRFAVDLSNVHSNERVVMPQTFQFEWVSTQSTRIAENSFRELEKIGFSDGFQFYIMKLVEISSFDNSSFEEGERDIMQLVDQVEKSEVLDDYEKLTLTHVLSTSLLTLRSVYSNAKSTSMGRLADDDDDEDDDGKDKKGPRLEAPCNGSWKTTAKTAIITGLTAGVTFGWAGVKAGAVATAPAGASVAGGIIGGLAGFTIGFYGGLVGGTIAQIIADCATMKIPDHAIVVDGMILNLRPVNNPLVTYSSVDGKGKMTLDLSLIDLDQ